MGCRSLASCLNDSLGIEIPDPAGVEIVDPPLDLRPQLRQLVPLERPLVPPVAQGLADDLATGGVLARRDGGAHRLGDCGSQGDSQAFDGVHKSYFIILSWVFGFALPVCRWSLCLLRL